MYGVPFWRPLDTLDPSWPVFCIFLKDSDTNNLPASILYFLLSLSVTSAGPSVFCLSFENQKAQRTHQLPFKLPPRFISHTTYLHLKRLLGSLFDLITHRNAQLPLGKYVFHSWAMN